VEYIANASYALDRGDLSIGYNILKGQCRYYIAVQLPETRKSLLNHFANHKDNHNRHLAGQYPAFAMITSDTK